MKIEISKDLISGMMAQLDALREKGGEDWGSTALGIFRGILIQETKGGKVLANSISGQSRKNRKHFKNSFRRS